MTTATEIRWLDFCDQQSTRFAINEPHVVSGWKIATDSVVAIAMPTDEPDTPPSERIWPNVSKILSPAIEQIGKVKPWPTPSPCQCCALPGLDDRVRCPTCKGTCKKECSTCGGAGTDYCDMGHEHDCLDCGGKGESECLDCVQGFVTRDTLARLKCTCVVKVGRMAIASPIFDKISRLPGVGYFVPHTFEDQVWIQFDGGGIGVVMQIQTTKETKWRN